MHTFAKSHPWTNGVFLYQSLPIGQSAHRVRSTLGSVLINAPVSKRAEFPEQTDRSLDQFGALVGRLRSRLGGLGFSHSLSWQSIPRTLAASLPGEMPLFNQAAEMVFQRVPAGAGRTYHVGHRGAAVLADVVDDLEVQLG